MKGEKYIQQKQDTEYMTKMVLNLMMKLEKNIMDGVINMMKNYA